MMAAMGCERDLRSGMFHGFADPGPVEWSWFAVDYRLGESWGEGADDHVSFAGVDRLLLYLACLRAGASNRLDLSRTLTYEPRHAEGHDAGILRWMSPGLELSLGDALDQTMISGDGVCSALIHEVLEESFGSALDLLSEFCEDQGMVRTSLEAGSPRGTPIVSCGFTTPREQVELLEGLLGSAGLGVGGTGRAIKGLDRGAATHALSVMRSVLKKSGLPGHLPGHGPYFTDAAHLCCDGGNGDARASEYGDAMIIFDEGSPITVAAVFFEGVGDTVEDVNGETWALDRFGRFGTWLYSPEERSNC